MGGAGCGRPQRPCRPRRGGGASFRSGPATAPPTTCSTWTVGRRAWWRAKPEGHTLTGVEAQSGKYGAGLPGNLPAYRRPLPFLYESTGVETRFTNGLDPDPRSRAVFAFHAPQTLAGWIGASTPLWELGQRQVAGTQAEYTAPYSLRGNLAAMPPLDAAGLWPVQAQAIRNLERSLAEARPRSLVQMATGSGKTFMACNQAYRLIRHAGARRVLFLVDRSNLGRQTLREFQGFTVPGDGRKFTELLQRATAPVGERRPG